VWRGGTAPHVGDLLATLEGTEAQLVLSYIVWPRGAPLPSVVDEWVRREKGPGGCLNAAMSSSHQVAPTPRRRMPRVGVAPSGRTGQVEALG